SGNWPKQESSMAGAVRYTRSIFTTETLAQELFSGAENLGDKWPKKIANLRKEFEALLLFTLRQFESLKGDLDCWRQKGSSGELDFESAQEDDCRWALRAFISLFGLLDGKFKDFYERGIRLAKPRLAGPLQGSAKEAQKIFDSWQSPEWEVVNERVVKWDK